MCGPVVEGLSMPQGSGRCWALGHGITDNDRDFLGIIPNASSSNVPRKE